MAEPIVVNNGRRGSRSNRRQQILVGILVVIALGALGSKMLFNGGGDDSFDDAFPVAPPSAQDPAIDLPESAGTDEWPAPRVNRNPFKPLIVSAPAESTAPDPSDPAVSSDPTTPIGLAPTAAPQTPVPPVVRSFTLVDVYTDGTGIPAATVRIDEHQIDVYVGQDFADSYRILSLERDDRCGVFLYGDRRFSLCAGETTLT